MKDKIKLKPKEYEKLKDSIEAHQYRFDAEQGLYIKTIRTIRGVAEAKRKAKKFILYTTVGTQELYLTTEGKLSENKKLARPFYYGFDVPSNREQYWSGILRCSLFHKTFAPDDRPEKTTKRGRRKAGTNPNGQDHRR